MSDRSLSDSFPDERQTRELIEALRAGDPRGVALFDQGFRNALTRFCWGYLGNMTEAEDAVQEVFLKVIQSQVVPDRFRTWVYKITRNHCLNELRSRGRRRDHHELPSASCVDAALTGQLTGLVRAELHDRLQELIQQLSDEQREVLRLRYVENLSRADIAEILDISESVVKSRLFEGLKKLRASVPDMEGT